jgi:hypothetical protein
LAFGQAPDRRQALDELILHESSEPLIFAACVSILVGVGDPQDPHQSAESWCQIVLPAQHEYRTAGRHDGFATLFEAFQQASVPAVASSSKQQASATEASGTKPSIRFGDLRVSDP